MESELVINNILDKINLYGISCLSYDERDYLEHYNSGSVDKGLEDWLKSDDVQTFDNVGNKLLYNEFNDDDDIFYNNDKLKRIISNFLNKTPYTNNSDWGDCYVWNVKKNR